MSKYISFLLLFLLLLIPDFAFAYIAVSNGYVEKDKFVRATVQKEKENFTIYAEDKIEMGELEEPEHSGIFALRDVRESYDKEIATVYSPISDKKSFFSTDRAIVLKKKVKLPKDGKETFVFSVKFDNGKESKITWNYRVLADDYARLSKRLNNGASVNIYDGDPISEVELTNFFPIDFLKDQEGKSSEVQVDLNGDTKNFTFSELKFAPQTSEKSLLIKPELNTSFIWRVTVLKVTDKENILEYEDTGKSDGSKDYVWNNKNFFGVPASPGKYMLVADVFLKTPYETARMPLLKKEIEIINQDRLWVLNTEGAVISDSNYNYGKVIKQKINKKKLCKGFIYCSLPGAYQYALNRIYMRRATDKFKICLVKDSIEKDSVTCYINSDIRKNYPVVLKKTSKGHFEGEIKTVLSDRDTETEMSFGPKCCGKKSFAYLDVTHPEDSLAFESILSSSGWISHGSFQADEPEDMTQAERSLFITDFVRCGGYEKLIFSAEDLKSQCLIKNQAYVFYYSGHGWGDGCIYLDDKTCFYPDAEFAPGDWSDGMVAAIFSSCSVLDIKNLNNHNFTLLGKVRLSPGKFWATASGKDVALLGYNWSTFEGKPPNAFDTRVVRSFLPRFLSGASPVDSWFNANFSQNEGVSVCAIYKDTYYYVQGGIKTLPKSNW